MYPGVLRNHFLPRTLRNRLRLVRASAVPDASHIVPGDHLDKATGLYVANLNESAVEEEDVGRVPGNSLRRSFPLDRTHTTTWVSVFIDV